MHVRERNNNTSPIQFNFHKLPKLHNWSKTFLTYINLCNLVQDVMLIAGGKDTTTYKDPAGYVKTLDVVMPDGTTCSEPSLPLIPERLEGFGIAARKNRYIYMCGGIKRSDSSSKNSCLIEYKINVVFTVF